MLSSSWLVSDWTEQTVISTSFCSKQMKRNLAWCIGVFLYFFFCCTELILSHDVQTVVWTEPWLLCTVTPLVPKTTVHSGSLVWNVLLKIVSVAWPVTVINGPASCEEFDHKSVLKMLPTEISLDDVIINSKCFYWIAVNANSRSAQYNSGMTCKKKKTLLKGLK